MSQQEKKEQELKKKHRAAMKAFNQESQSRLKGLKGTARDEELARINEDKMQLLREHENEWDAIENGTGEVNDEKDEDENEEEKDKDNGKGKDKGKEDEDEDKTETQGGGNSSRASLDLSSTLNQLEIGKASSSSESPLPGLNGQATGNNKKTKAQRRRETKRMKEREEAKAKKEAIANAGPSKRERELEMLRKKLEPAGLMMVDIPADGNCLYSAVADQLDRRAFVAQNTSTPIAQGNNPGASAFENDSGKFVRNSVPDFKKLRRICASYVESHREDFEPFIVDESFEEYVNKVRNTSEWGGQLELRALACALHSQIKVFQANGSPLVMEGRREGEQHEENSRPLLVSYHKDYYALGEHYNSVVPIGG